MTNSTAVATMITLKLVRANGSPIAGVQDTWTVSVPTLTEADNHLAMYRDSERAVTAYATGAEGEWLGSGRAGSGTVRTNWI
jgi:hypothetical protein